MEAIKMYVVIIKMAMCICWTGIERVSLSVLLQQRMKE